MSEMRTRLGSEIEHSFATKFNFDGQSLKIDVAGEQESPPMGFLITALACLISFAEAHGVCLQEAMEAASQTVEDMPAHPSDLMN